VFTIGMNRAVELLAKKAAAAGARARRGRQAAQASWASIPKAAARST
jgi:topoisomerase IA-like protein